VLQDLNIKARRPQGGRFGAQTTNIAVDHPVELLCEGIGDLSNRHTDHGGLTKILDLHDACRSPGAQKDPAEQQGTPTLVFNRTYDHSAQEIEI
jgi:hypothetical protein